MKEKQQPDLDEEGLPRNRSESDETRDEVRNTAAFFAKRRERADFEAFGRIMRRQGGEPPREGNEQDD